MKSPQSHRGTGAFTLVELLTVIAIIGILAALLLPVLEQSKARAKLVWCGSNLGQIGIAFHSFAHDHNSKFPMQVSAADGGAEEFVQNGYRVNGEFYFAFRNFQAMATELATTKILVCPADERRRAINFPSLQNSNLSYFIGVSADYSQPESILSGDRNIASVSDDQSIYRATAAQELRWSGIMHQFKGNLLFADGHVEESKGFQLAASAGSTAQNVFFVPTANRGNTTPQSQPTFYTALNKSSPGGLPASPNPFAEPDGPAKTSQMNGTPVEPLSGQNTNRRVSAATTGQSLALSQTSVAVSSRITTNITTNQAASTPTDEYAGMSPSDRRAAKLMRDLFGWSYLLLLLLFLLWLSFKVRREWRRWQARRQARLGGKSD